MQNLCVLIDTTASMSHWIDALRKMLPEFMHTVALTGVFDSIGIMSYKDYDVQNVAEWSGWKSFSDPTIFQFAKELVASGGGGIREATRTALYKLISDLPDSGELVIMHLADAPEHSDNHRNLDNEGFREANALGNKFPITVLAETLLTNLLAKKLVLRYSSITSCAISQLMRTLQTAYPGQHIPLDNIYGTSISDSMMRVFNNWCDGSSQWVIPEVSRRLNTAVVRLRTDDQFATYTYECLKQCFNDNVMSMCNNETIGKIWREFCKRRGDQRRGELFTILDKSKNRLDSTSRKKFEEFNRNSYSNITEIEENLQIWIKMNGINGLIRYVPDALLHPQDILKFCQDCSPESQKQIKEILARLVLDPFVMNSVSENSKLEDVTDDQKEILFPKNCLPANMPSHLRMKYILHLAAPGTAISGRPQMILAMLALGTVLDADAKEVLQNRKGKWLDFSYFEEEGPLKGTPKIPENYNSQFLRLISKHREYLTEEEIAKLDWLLNILNVLRLPQIELKTEVMDFGCLNGNYPSHGYKCVECKEDRPLSLVNLDGKCGYCFYSRECPFVFNPNSCYQIQCTKCFAVYARDPQTRVPGRAMCHWCRQGNEFVGKSPNVQCKGCNIKYITYHGLPNDMCAICSMTPSEEKKQRIVTVLRRALEVFDPYDFVQMYKSVGIESPDIIQVGLLKAQETLKTCEPVSEEYKTKEFDHMLNRADLYQKMLGYVKGRRIDLPECALCCNQVRTDQIGRACGRGRKGCSQRICDDCGTSWYGVLKPGALILERHLVCPFCARKPDSRVIRRWCPGADWFSVQGALDPQSYYAWCVRCNYAKVVGDRGCHAIQPNIVNWTCNECQEQLRNPVPAAHNVNDPNFKHCPNCDVLVDRFSGCNHITCVCGVHWCYECGLQCANADDTLHHMRTTHGRIYAGEDPYWSDVDNLDLD